MIVHCAAFRAGRAAPPTCARAIALALVLAVILRSGSIGAQEARTAFRPCIDPDNLPFANTKGEGFENRIAELFAQKLGLPVKNYAFPQRMNFVRNTLRYKLPGEDFRCDVVMSVPAGYDQVAATTPYYRSTYALVFPKGKAWKCAFRRRPDCAASGTAQSVADRHL
jgi:ABC-type amino acid transport substrate-binding protein